MRVPESYTLTSPIVAQTGQGHMAAGAPKTLDTVLSKITGFESDDIIEIKRFIDSGNKTELCQFLANYVEAEFITKDNETAILNAAFPQKTEPAPQPGDEYYAARSGGKDKMQEGWTKSEYETHLKTDTSTKPAIMSAMSEYELKANPPLGYHFMDLKPAEIYTKLSDLAKDLITADAKEIKLLLLALAFKQNLDINQITYISQNFDKIAAEVLTEGNERLLGLMSGILSDPAQTDIMLNTFTKPDIKDTANAVLTGIYETARNGDFSAAKKLNDSADESRLFQPGQHAKVEATINLVETETDQYVRNATLQHGLFGKTDEDSIRVMSSPDQKSRFENYTTKIDDTGNDAPIPDDATDAELDRWKTLSDRRAGNLQEAADIYEKYGLAKAANSARAAAQAARDLSNTIARVLERPVTAAAPQSGDASPDGHAISSVGWGGIYTIYRVWGGYARRRYRRAA
jgi:hypothetical protein